MNTADLLVTGGTVLTVDDLGTVVLDGAVVVRDGVIVEVGPAAEVAGRYRAAEVLDVPGCLGMPGLINTHAHLAMNLFRGEADDVTLEEFLRRVLRAELVQLTADAVAAGADVRRTVVDGWVLLRDRELTTIDEPAVLDRVVQLRPTRNAGEEWR